MKFDKRAGDVLIWALLLTAPFWLPLAGSYVELGTRVVIYALAAMALNFLLGYTGVLSFGHAAYFGLGAYGTALTIKYLIPSTPVGMLAGIVLGTVAAAIIGPMIVRLRGVYFAMCTIAFGQVFYFIAFQWFSLTGGDDGVSAWHREPLNFGFATLDILNSNKAFYYFVLAVFAVSAAAMAFLLALAVRPHAAGDPRERAPGALPRHSGRPAYLDVVGRLLLLRQHRRHAVLADERLRRSPRAALGPVRKFRYHGGAGRHAQLLGAADRRGDLFGAAGLHFERDAELDVVHRPVLRPRRAVLPTRRFGHHPAKGDNVTLLRVEKVSKHFGSLVAVDNVSMTVEPGELRAVIGPNGAGKTTFFNLISGFLSQSSGQIIFDGEDISGLLPARRVWRGIARTFQITEVFPELTIRENLKIAVEVASGYRLRMWQSEEADVDVKKRVVELLEVSGLSHSADRLVGELAHGDQRATEIMMALALKPRLLLLDEPTAGMGDQETYNITQLIRKLHKDGKLTIVLIEHDMRVVFHLADRIMVLDQGKFLAEGTPPEIAANKAVQTAYLGQAA